jgi:hypothetical protein
MNPIEKPVPARKPRFYAQFQGTIRMTCPGCGYIGIYRVKFGTYTLRCVNNGCRRTWAVGLLLHPMDPHAGRSPGRPAQMPVDMLLPVYTLSRDPWQSGMHVHEVEGD